MNGRVKKLVTGAVLTALVSPLMAQSYPEWKWMACNTLTIKNSNVAQILVNTPMDTPQGSEAIMGAANELITFGAHGFSPEVLSYPVAATVYGDVVDSITAHVSGASFPYQYNLLNLRLTRLIALSYQCAWDGAE